MPPVEPVVVLRGHSDDVDSLAFSPDSNLLVSVATDATVRVWNAKAVRRNDAWTGHRVGIGSCQFHPHGDRLVSGGWDGQIKVWDVPGLCEMASAKAYSGHVTALTMSPDGRLILTCGDTKDGARAKLWSVDPLSEILEFPGHLKATACAFSPNGRLAVVADSGEQSRLAAWDVGTLQQIETRPIDERWVNQLVFSPDGRRVFMTATSGLSVWDVTDWSLSFLKHNTNACLLPRDGRVYVAVSGGSVCVCNNVPDADDVDKTVFCLQRDAPGKGYESWQLALSPDGTRAVVYDDDAPPELWNLADRCLVARLGDQPVYRCAFSPDSTSLFTSEPGGFVVLRGAHTGDVLCRQTAGIGNPRAIAFSPDSRYVCAGDGLGHLQLLALEDLWHKPFARSGSS